MKFYNLGDKTFDTDFSWILDAVFLHIIEFPKCQSRKNLNCQVHQNMKLNAELLTNSNSKTIYTNFMRRKNAQ